MVPVREVHSYAMEIEFMILSHIVNHIVQLDNRCYAMHATMREIQCQTSLSLCLGRSAHLDLLLQLI